MATQYTPILQLALPVTGEINGTWGDVVNNNITSMVEQAIAGLATINTWTTNSHTLTTADGTTDEARCAMLVAATGAGGTALTAAGEIICPARTKLYVLSNTSAYTVTLKTAAGSGISVPSGDTTFLFCDGTDINACVTTIVNGHISGNLTVDGNTTLGNATTDTITATARFNSDLLPSADNSYDLGTSGNSWRNLYIDGTATIATLNVTTIDTTNLEVTNIKAKDGTASATIADATGVMTIGSSVLTTTDINGGTIDGTTIGATTASTGRFTQVNVTGQGDLRLEDTTGGEYVALQAPGTLAASYTLTMPADDGTNGQALITDGAGNLSWSTAASGNVYGPASATDNAVARFDLTTGKIIQNSGVIIDDSNNVTGVAALTASGDVTLSGGTANGVVYANGSKVLTTGSALTFNGTTLSAPDVQVNSSPVLTDADIGSTVQAYDADLTAWSGKTAPTGTVVGTSDTQTLTNKTISADTNTLSGVAPSSFVLSNASGNIDGTVAQKVIPSGVVVGTSDTQTLTNKTLTSPTLTTPNINSAQFATVSGTAPLYACRAWVNFNGTGTVAIRASGNVSSITENDTGDFRINFATATPDVNYSFTGSAKTEDNNVINAGNNVIIVLPYSYQTGSVSLRTSNNVSIAIDPVFVNVAIFR